MVTLATAALEGKGTLSDTLDQQHGSPPLPSGAGAGLRQTLRVSSTVGHRPPVEEGLGVVWDDHHPLADRVFTVGRSYEALTLNAERAIDTGTRLALKIHERGEGAVKPGRRVFVPKVGTEERIMDFLKRYVREKK